MKTDVLIVGAGPSGVSCARQLDQAGIDYLIIDPITPDPENFLPNLIPPKTVDDFGEIPEECRVGVCDRYVVGTRERLAPVPAEVIGLNNIGFFVNRNAYLLHLRESVADHLRSLEAVSFSVQSDGVITTVRDPGTSELLDISSEIIVIATGMAGCDFGSPQIPVPKLFKTVWATFTPLQGTDRDNIGELAILWNEKVSKKGYLNWYNIPGVNFFMAILDKVDDETEFGNLMDRAIEAHPFVSEFLKNSTIVKRGSNQDYVFLDLPDGIIPKTFSDRVLVTGARAGFANTYVREGTWQALTSGACAGETIISAIARNDFSTATLARYRELWKERLDRPNLKPGRASASVFYDSGKLNLIAEALTKGLIKEDRIDIEKRTLQRLFLKTMMSSEYSRKNDMIWAKALLKNVSTLNKITLTPILLKTAFKG